LLPVAVKEGTVLESIKDLTAQYPDLDKHLFNEEQKLRGFVRIFLGEDDIEISMAMLLQSVMVIRFLLSPQ
jgi:hypothetical protein